VTTGVSAISLWVNSWLSRWNLGICTTDTRLSVQSPFARPRISTSNIGILI